MLRQLEQDQGGNKITFNNFKLHVSILTSQLFYLLERIPGSTVSHEVCPE